MTRNPSAPAVRARLHAPEAPGRPPARPVTVVGYALGLLALAMAAVVGLLAAGAALPPVGVVLVLAVPLALCMNRFVFFPNEVGATAEAAVVFAALVAFRHASPVLGPVLLALLVGVLDARHWERRAFVRMAYNSGSQALTVLATSLAFGPLLAVTGPSDAGRTTACLLAATVYVALETGFGVVLVVVLGERWRASLRHQLPVNSLAVPLALLGGAVGVIGGATEWWVAGVLLLPIAFVPELVLVGMRRPDTGRDTTLAAALAVLGVLSVALDRLPSGRGLGAVVAVVGLALVLAGDARRPRRRSLPPVGALVLAAAAALASVPWVAAACVACAVLALVVDGDHQRAVWSVPLAGAGAAIAVAARATPLPAGGLTVFGVAALVLAVSTWGALPWSSRVLGPWGARRRRSWPVAVLVVASGTCVVAATLWAVAGVPVAGRVALAAAAIVLACAAAAVRQWRFAPRIRRRDGALLAVGVLVLLGSGALGVAGGTTGAALGCITTVGIGDALAVACTRAQRGGVPHAGARIRSP